MKTHEDYREALALHALGAVENGERRELESHLETCPSCLRELADLRETAADLVLLAKPLAPSPERLQGILDRLEAGRGETSADEIRRGSVRAATARRSVRDLLKSKPIVWTARFTVAAVLALLTVSQINLLERLDRAYAELGRMHEIGQFVTSPGVSVVPLWGTEVARGAHAKVAYEHATGRFMLFSSRLPVPPGGKRYQLWVISDRVRPAGAFSLESPNGTLPTRPRGDEPFLFGVSLEPDGASEASEPGGGMVLMSGPVRYPG